MKQKKKIYRLRRAFMQRGLHGLVQLVNHIEQSRREGVFVQEIGSSSIHDPSGHVARIKKAMGIQQSIMDGVWAYFGDTDASLYVGFFPGKKPCRIDPLDWLIALVDSIHRIPRDSQIFLDNYIKILASVTFAPQTALSWEEPGLNDEPMLLN